MIKKISIHLFIFSFFILPVFAIASGPTTGNDPTKPTTGNEPTPISINIPNPLNCGSDDKSCSTLIGLITLILNNIVMPIAAVAVVIWIIWAGFQYLLAQGNPEAIKKAHDRLRWSLIGAGILLGAAAIAQVVEKTIGGLIGKN